MEYGTWIALAPTGASMAIYLVVMTAFCVVMLRRKRRPRAEPTRAPLVTVFKPLAGLDDGLDDNLESFAKLDYPAYEVLLGVASLHDPAAAVARRFVERHPRLAARVVITDADAAVNPKVAQLIGLDRHARGDVVVISDSNVRVKPDYLWTLVGELLEPNVGLATTLFVGTGEDCIGAALENLQLGVMIVPSIALASFVTRRPPTVGKSMAMWRRDLVRLGGFARVGGVLAEDHVLGRLFLDAGFEVRTSLDHVENRNVECSDRRSLERHTRWAQMRRVLYPLPFAVELMGTPLAVASLVALIDPTRPTLAAMLAVGFVQSVVAFLSLAILRGRGLRWYYAPLEAVRTVLVVVCWLRAAASLRIVWRGHPFMLGADTTIVPLTDAATLVTDGSTPNPRAYPG
jgi:ceramide glucosyltransferase